MILCACAGWFGSVHFAHAWKHIFYLTLPLFVKNDISKRWIRYKDIIGKQKLSNTIERMFFLWSNFWNSLEKTIFLAKKWLYWWKKHKHLGDDVFHNVYYTCDRTDVNILEKCSLLWKPSSTVQYPIVWNKTQLLSLRRAMRYQSRPHIYLCFLTKLSIPCRGLFRKISTGVDFIKLLYLVYVFGKTDQDKQCQLRSDAAERGIWSGSTLFATHSGLYTHS